MEVRPIGVVISTATEPGDEGWGRVISEIRLEERFAPGLKGMDQFSHVLVLFWMHLSTFEESKHLVRRPRDRADMPEVGIFAHRAKHRPNPIGVTAVRLLGVEDNVLRVQGLDAIDGTPVLDVKPYYPAFDRVAGATVPEYVDVLMKDYF